MLTNVPDNEVDKIVKYFTQDGAATIVKELQSDGTWTVRAVFKDS